jgi:hypothetical protein
VVVRYDVLGTSCCSGLVWNQGEAESAGLERENNALLDSDFDGRGSGFRDYGIAEDVVS